MEFGLTYRGNGAAVHWQKPGFPAQRPDHDTVECFVLFSLPVFPFKAYHTFNWSGEAHEAVEIRRTKSLLLHAMLRPYCIAGMAIAGPLFGIFSLVVVTDLFKYGVERAFNPHSFPIALASGIIMGASIGIWRWLRSSYRRNRDIRLVLGPHDLGSSDPAMWADQTLAAMKPSWQMFDTSSYHEGARKAFNNGRFAQAMLAARLSVANGENEGENRTDEILNDFHVRENLEALRKKPWRRDELFPDDSLQAADLLLDTEKENICCRDGKEVTEKNSAKFYDGRLYCDSCLNKAGGRGYADAVRAEPVLKRRVPDSWIVSFFFLALAALFLSVGISSLLNPSEKEKVLIFVGTLIWLSLLTGRFLYGLLRRVRLGGKKLIIGKFGTSLMLDNVTHIRRRLWLGIVPIVAICAGRTEIATFSRAGRGWRDIERSLKAVIKLRSEASE